jgi:catechol 2,3-dioxygenase-like lactoylglutathione lyase family enzyme
MSSSQTSVDSATKLTGAVAVAMRFEVTTLPVADVDRAKDFYQRMGWRLDIDLKPSPDTRGVQFTPPGSPASIQFGQGTTTMTRGSLQGMRSWSSRTS